MITYFFRFFFIFLAIISTSNLFGQIKILEGEQNLNYNNSPIYFDITKTRTVIPLNNNWSVFNEDDPGKSIKLRIPASFEGMKNIVFQTTFDLTKLQISKTDVELHFLRLNYSADILLNEVVIAKHTGGNYSFSILLPKDLLKAREKNVLRIKLNHELDSETTIPVAQRFLFPRNNGGLLAGVYLHTSPSGGIKNLSIGKQLNNNLNLANIDIDFDLVKNPKGIIDLLKNLENKKSVKISILDQNFNNIKTYSNKDIAFAKNSNSFNIRHKFEIAKPNLWKTANPNSYFIKIEYFANNNLIDETTERINFLNIIHDKNGISVNGKPFNISGTTYYFDYFDYGNIIDIEQLKKDLSIIKKSGFNTIRFAKGLPLTYAIHICNKLGLFVQVELPINSVPDQILIKRSFIERAKALAASMLSEYGKFENIIGFGVGSSFLPNDSSNLKFIENIASYIKSRSRKIIYASFLKLPERPIGSIDLYGIELFDKIPDAQNSIFSSAIDKLGKRNIFISEATYPTHNGNTNGYLNKYSHQGQAKFFENLISLTRKSHIGGMVINSMFDFRGDFTSLYAGYSENNLYRIGILGENRRADRTSFKLVSSKLLNKEKVTIPIGTKKDSSPILFIILSVLLSIIMAVLINSKKKFREDATRALLRSYNFFADIRDLRIISGLHTTLLMLTLSGVLSLLATIVLTYLRNSIFLEKVILSFNWHWLSYSVSYIAWHPLHSFLYLWIFFIVFILLHVGIIKVFSLFIKTRVLTTSIFFTVVWALLPLVLILPIELFLHRLLLAEIANSFIYWFIFAYILWLIQRVFKGIYVIFDIRLSTVYFYGISLFILFAGIIIIYFQLTDSTIYYLISAFKQYQYL